MITNYINLLLVNIMSILVFDTETTGLPQFRVSPNNNNISTWPYIVQLSYILYDTDKNKIINTYDSIIKLPKEVSISEESSNIHGITNSEVALGVVTFILS